MDSPVRRFLRRRSLRDQVLDALRTALVSGELTPGEVYSAPVLAERFGVSATPVREAMQHLVREGLVEAVANKGFRVAQRSRADLAELAEVRALLEVPVLLKLARTVPAERWQELRPLAQATVEAAATGDRAVYAEADLRFHCALLALSGNRQLVAFAAELHRRSRSPAPARGTGTALGGEASGEADAMVTDATEHAALIEALVAGDLGTVARLARRHFAGLAEV